MNREKLKNLSREELIRVYLKEKTKALKLSRANLIDFTKYTFPKYQVNWHHLVIADYLQKLYEGDIKRLMIFTPPRHGKSELVSRRFPAWVFGKNPNEQVISASYSDDLSSRMNRDVQRIIDSEEYRELFPQTQLSGKGVQAANNQNYLRNTDVFEIVNHKGLYRSAGIRTGITGMGFSLGLIDDPIKDRAEADSVKVRQSVWDWFGSVFMTRAEKDARVCITQTRWHKSDLAGKILEMISEGGNLEEWTILNLPAVIENDDLSSMDPMDPRKIGEALWPEKYNLQRLAEIKQTIGSRDWAALYQQRPVIEGGNIVQRSWWKFFETPPVFDQVIQSWDLTFKKTDGSDFVVGQIWGRKGAEKFLLDQIRAQMTFTETVRAVQSLSKKWPMAHRKVIEDKANGPAVIDALKKEISGVIPVNPKESKESRAHSVSPQIEAGNVYLPKNAAWVHDFIEEWSAFPNGNHDDQVDACTQAIIQMGGSSIARLEKLLQF